MSEYQETRTYELASYTERIIALIIDSLIVGAIGGALGAGGGSWFLGGSLIGFLIGAGYQWYFLTRQNGQTFGKMVMNIQVIKTDGTPISDAEAIFRYIGYLINTPLLMIGWLWAFVDDKRQGFHDKLANTYVIKVPRELLS
ncbi:MAG: RDD family protein [Chloroflexota bacterium]